MKIKMMIRIAVFILISGFLAGCAGNYGSLTPQNDRISIADLEANNGDYIIHSSTWQRHTPAALMFDPKNNATTLTGSSWTRINDPAAVSETIKIITRSYPYRQVFEITDSQDRPLGYIISPTRNIYVKAIDEKTHFISGLRKPADGP